MLLRFPHVGLDLTDSGQVVVEKRVHGGGGLALDPVAVVGGEGVGQGSRDEERDRRERKQGELRVVNKAHGGHQDHLEERHHPLFDAVDEHPLHRSHVFHEPRHHVARGAVVKPADRQPLDVAVEVAPQIEDHPLLKGVVEPDAHGVGEVL